MNSRRTAATLALAVVVLLTGCARQDQAGAPATAVPAATTDPATPAPPPPPSPPPSPGPQEDAAAVLAAAPDATVAGGSLAIATQMVIEVPGAPGATVTANGVIDYRSGGTQITLDSTDGAYEVRTTDGVVQYLRMPPEAGLPTPWLRIDPAEAAEVLPPDLQLGTSTDVLPGYLAAGAVGEVERVGPDQAAGTDCTRYRYVADPEQVVANSDEAVREVIERNLSRLTAIGVTEFAVDACLDGQGRVVQEVYQAQLALDGATGTMRATSTYTDFGLPVTVGLPPDAEVTDLAALRSGGG